MEIKIQLTILLLFISIACYSQQENKFILSIEASPMVSKIGDPIISNEFKLSLNYFANIEYPISRKTNLLASIGLINTGEKISSELNGSLGIDKIETVSNIYLIVLPVGTKHYFKGFYIAPQSAVAFYIYDSENYSKLYANGEEENEKRRIQLGPSKFNKVTIPLMLTFGKEIKLNKIYITLGIKGYYSLNELIINTPARSNKYYGFGATLGVKI